MRIEIMEEIDQDTKIEKVKVNISNTILEVDKRILLEITYFKVLYDKHWKTPDDILDINNENISLIAFMFIIDKYNGKNIRFQNEFIPTFEFLGIEYNKYIDFTDLYKTYFNNKINMYNFQQFSKKYKVSMLDILKYFCESFQIDICKNDELILDAAIYGYLDVIQFIYENLCKNTPKPVISNDAILYAATYGHYEIVIYLYEVCKCDPKNQYSKSLQAAAQNGHLNIIRYLYETCKCDPTANNNYVFRAAATNGFLEVVKYLNEICNVKANNSNSDIINDVIKRGHLNVVKYLYETCKFCFNTGSNHPLYIASTSGHFQVVKYINEVSKPSSNLISSCIDTANNYNYYAISRYLKNIT
jgi:hypothetical protein